MRKTTNSTQSWGYRLRKHPIKNRFEIRLKDERAYYAVRELLTHYDAEQTAFSIINHYIRFVDREPEKRKTDWKLNDRWAWFIGERPPACQADNSPRALHIGKDAGLDKPTGRTYLKNAEKDRRWQQHELSERD